MSNRNREELREDIALLIEDLKWCIDDECRAFEEDDEPGIQLTIGTNGDMSDYGWQSGDNSYSGAAYGYPYWAVVGVYVDTSASDLAQDCIDQLEGQIDE